MTVGASAASSSSSSSRGVRRRWTAVRTGSAVSRIARPLAVTESPVARSTEATLAPVSSSIPAMKRKTAMMWAPTSPTSVEAAS